MSELLEELAVSSGGTTPPDETISEHVPAEPSRRLEIIIAAAALALSIVAVVLAATIRLRMGGGGLDPRWWPTVLASSAAVLSAILLAFALFAPLAGRGDLEAMHADGRVRMLLALALSVLYALAWQTVGYIGPTLIYLVALLWLFGLRGWKGLVAFPIITTALIYGLFHLMLRVPL